MPNKPLLILALVLGLLSNCACSGPPAAAKPHRVGPKINIANFISQPTTYKGKTLTLGLKVDESVLKGKVQSLGQLAGREVPFTTTTPSGERLSLVIKIPTDLPTPDVGLAEDLVVTFVCDRGDLRQGNVAKLIQTSAGPWEDVD